MLPQLKEGNSVQLTLWSEDSPVKIFPSPGTAKASSKARVAVSGLNSPVLLARYDHAASCWKMSQLSLLSEEHRLLATLPRWGIAQNGELYQRQPLALPTDESDGSAWPTPNTMDTLPPHSAESMERQYNGHRKGRTAPSNLRDYIHPQLWPTPRAVEIPNKSPDRERRDKNKMRTPADDNLSTRVKRIEQWSTPQARDWKGSTGINRHSPNLPNQVEGYLNPSWVEQLMGYPSDWTTVNGPLDQTKHKKSGSNREPRQRKPKTTQHASKP